jgi:Type VI secretion system/phage-baseplate injector OB domain
LTPLSGIYRATVIGNQDPLGRQRLSIRLAGAPANVWAEACVPYQSHALPPAGSSVWVLFEGGDPAHPVWIGTHS